MSKNWRFILFVFVLLILCLLEIFTVFLISPFKMSQYNFEGIDTAFFMNR